MQIPGAPLPGQDGDQGIGILSSTAIKEDNLGSGTSLGESQLTPNILEAGPVQKA